MNHERYMRSYVAFYLQYRIDDLDPTAAQLSAYVEFLLHSGISPSTIPNFLSGVKHYLQAAEMDASALMSYTLSLTLRSLRIDYSQTPNRKKALTLPQVRRLVDYCNLRGSCVRRTRTAVLPKMGKEQATIFTAVRNTTDTLASASRRSTRPSPGNVRLAQSHPHRHTIRPHAIDTHTPRLRAEFRQALIACDLDPRRYTPHSLRRGGATLLQQHGAQRQDIKRQGLWEIGCCE